MIITYFDRGSTPKCKELRSYNINVIFLSSQHNLMGIAFTLYYYTLFVCRYLEISFSLLRVMMWSLATAAKTSGEGPT